MRPLRVIALSLLSLLWCFCASAQIPKFPTDSKVYRLGAAPKDGLPHWVQNDYPTTIRGIIRVYLPATLGKSYGRPQDEADKDIGNSLSALSLFELPDRGTLNLSPCIANLNDGGISRNLIIYLESSPEEGQTRIGSAVLDISETSALLNQVDDLLRVGRNWRDMGVPDENKRINLDSLKGVFGGPLGLSIEKVRNEAGLRWYVFSKRVCFCSSNLLSLSRFRDQIRMANDWLDKFKATDKIEPPKQAQ